MARNDISMEQVIKEAEQEIELICSITGQAYIRAANEKEGMRLIAVDSDLFQQWFRSYCYDGYGMILPSGGHIQAQAHIKMLAKRNGKRSRIHKRIYDKTDAVYYDLGRNDGKYLKITADGARLAKNSHILFQRSELFAPQVEPEMEQVCAEDVKYFIAQHFNFRSETDQILFAAFLAGCFFGKQFSKPVLEVYGQKSSAKSTCLKRVQNLIDSLTVNPLFSMPKRENEVAMCLASEYMVCFDNISFISQNTSDLICRNCTGGSQVKRKLFTDDSRSILEPDAVVCFNSTRQCIVRSDLADRAIFLELERISLEKMQGDRELQKKWNDDLPYFFGALCRVVSGMLGDKKPAMNHSPVRLVDFYEMAVKAGRQIGYKEEQVHEAFCTNREKINDSLVSGNILLTVLEGYMNQKGMEEGLKARVSEFYREMKLYALEEYGIDGRSFPGAPEVMTRRMSENRSNLEDIGIFYDVRKGKDARYIEIWKE